LESHNFQHPKKKVLSFFSESYFCNLQHYFGKVKEVQNVHTIYKSDKSSIRSDTSKIVYKNHQIKNLLDFQGGFNKLEFQDSQKEYQKLSNDGFRIDSTNNFDKVIEYCVERFKNSPNSFCTLSSSQGFIDEDIFKGTNKNVFRNSYKHFVKLDINQHLKNNALSEDCNYYSLLEYSSIVFEVEIPIILWGPDFVWYKNKLKYDLERKITGKTKYRKNMHQGFLNCGRIGTILYFPPT